MQVQQRGLLLFEQTLSQAAGHHSDEVYKMSSPCFRDLLAKLGDNNTRIREKALEAMLQAAANPSVGRVKILELLSRPLPSQSCKPLVWTARIGCSEKVISQARISKTPIAKSDLRPTVSLAASGFHSPKEDVRIQAYTLLMELYRAYGRSDLLDLLQPSLFRKQ